MSPNSKDDCRRFALRVYQDPTAPGVAKQLARMVLVLVDGRLPAGRRA